MLNSFLSQEENHTTLGQQGFGVLKSSKEALLLREVHGV